MSRARRSPGATTRASSESSDRDVTDGPQPSAAADYPAGLRRRRAASWRCESLLDGRRDPFDPRPVETWTAAEVASWRITWAHFRRLGYTIDVPASVVAAGRRVA